MIGVREVAGERIFNDGWYAGAEKLPSPFFNERPFAEISVIVIHNISLPAGVFGTPFVKDLFLGCLDCQQHESFADLVGLEVSSHFFINRLGEIQQFVAVDKRAWHAGVSEYNGRANVNNFSVGIELEGTDTVPYTNEQYVSLEKLCRDLMAEFAIPLASIVGHCHIAPERKTDPGASFNWQAFRQSLQDET